MFLSRFLDHDPARPALATSHDATATAPSRWLTYGDLRARGESAAAWLASEGVRPGDIVAIHLENSLDLVDAHLGCMALGAVRLPLNPHYREAELTPILEDAAPCLVITAAPERFPGFRSFSGPHPAAQDRDGAPLHEAPDQPTSLPADRLWPDRDLTALLFTSGTTGRPKGVPQTFSMWGANLDALATLWQLSGDDCLWLALPLFHTHGLVLGLHGTLLRGSRAILRPRFEPVLLPGEVTHVYGVPTWYRRWLPVMQADPEPFRRLTLMVSGSDGLDRATSDAVYAATGHRILERYGMTETVMICSNPGRGERRAGTVGPPVPGVSVRLVDGEVQVSGPSVYSGYWGQPLRVAESPRSGSGAEAPAWFSTGDAGEWDDAGYLRIVGRKKELIIVGGVNVSPAEVEAIYAGLPGVREVGAVGLPDDDLNEGVGLAVVVDGDVAEALAAVRERGQMLSGLKRPRRVIVLDALPRNALGKLQRGALKAAFPGGSAPDAT